MKLKVKIKEEPKPIKEDLKITDRQKACAEEDIEYLQYICSKMDSLNPKNLGGIEEIKFEEDDDNINWKEKYKSLLMSYINSSEKITDLENKIKKLENYKFECEDLSNRLDNIEDKFIKNLREYYYEFRKYVIDYNNTWECHAENYMKYNLNGVLNSLLSIILVILQHLEEKK